MQSAAHDLNLVMMGEARGRALSDIRHKRESNSRCVGCVAQKYR